MSSSPAFASPWAAPTSSRLIPSCNRTRRRPRYVNAPRAQLPDPYEVLGVPRDADASAIKRAYRRAALRNHPDVNSASGAKERFLQVQEAYRILSDASERARYDAATRPSSSDFGSSVRDAAESAREYARRWREKNPMPEDLDDSLSSILSDLFSSVGNAASANASSGVVGDFLDFLEKSVGDVASGMTGGGGGKGNASYGSVERDPGLEALLQNGNVDTLDAEIRDVCMAAEQARTRAVQLEKDAQALATRSKKWSARAENMRRERQYMARKAAEEQQTQLAVQSARLGARARVLIDEAERLEEVKRKLQKRRDEVKNEEVLREKERRRGRSDDVHVGSSNDSSDADMRRSTVARKQQGDNNMSVDEELERMKRELGLS